MQFNGFLRENICFVFAFSIFISQREFLYLEIILNSLRMKDETINSLYIKLPNYG